MKIAVIGAGIFGSTVAIKLANAGHCVYLFEKDVSVLSHASAINQYRLHRGYHYPRSTETVKYVKESSVLFENEFPTAICRNNDRYYAISNEGSFINPEQYLQFLEINGLEYRIIENIPLLKKDKVSLIVKVQEYGFDYRELYLSVVSKLSKSGVCLRTNSIFLKEHVFDYDIVVNATYSNINEILPDECKIPYQYELCEKPVVQLSESFINKSVVVIDGDFCCIDPFGFNVKYQVMGHVKEAIHDRKVQIDYNVPTEYMEVINKGVIQSPLSKFNGILRGFSEYFNVSDLSYKGSMYTVRTVLPHHEHDDARPSNIIKHNDRLYSIFSGKIGTCVDIANELVKQI